MCDKFNKPYEMLFNWETQWLWDKFPIIKNDMEFWSNLPALSYPNELPDNIQLVHHLTACPHKKPRAFNLRELGWLTVTKKSKTIDEKITCEKDKVSWLRNHIDEWDVFVDDKPETINNCRVAFPDKHIIRFVPSYMDDTHQDFLDEMYSQKYWEKTKEYKLSKIKHLSQLKQLGYAE